jgi:hypothetical protein
MTDIHVHRSRAGDLSWKSYLEPEREGNGNGKAYVNFYVLVVNPSRNHFEDTKGVLEVGRREGRLGWEVRLFGEVVGTYTTKWDAQADAETLVA